MTYIHYAHTLQTYMHTYTNAYIHKAHITHTHTHTHTQSQPLCALQQTASGYDSPFNSQVIRCQHNSYQFTSTLRHLKQSANVSIHRDKADKCFRQMWASLSAQYFLFSTAWRTDVRACACVCMNRERASLTEQYVNKWINNKHQTTLKAACKFAIDALHCINSAVLQHYAVHSVSQSWTIPTGQ